VRVIDSSGWIEFLMDGPGADAYAPHVTAPDVLTPTIVVYEVYRIIRREASEEDALTALAYLQTTTVVGLGMGLAMDAAEASLEHGLAMADAIVYATARQYGAELLTSDADLAGLPGVTYIPKRPDLA